MTARRPQERGHVLEVSEIEQLLRAEVERLVWELLPNARRDGHHLCVGSIAGEPGQSLKVEISGARQGGWRDFANPDSDEGHGDCLKLIALTRFGGELGPAVAWAKSWLGLDHLDPGRIETKRVEAREKARESAVAAEEEKKLKRRRAVALWLGGKPIAGTPAEAYLRGREIELHPDGLDHWPGSLRFVSECYNREQGVKMPAMVASMVRPDGSHVATHRTYLSWSERHGWVKMDSPNAKMVLGSCGGSFIPLRKGASGRSMAEMPAGEWIHMPEGIEDALVGAMARPRVRIGAGYSVGNIGSIAFPETLRRTAGLVIWADRDAAGSDAVDALERTIGRQQAQGTAVRIVMPPPPFKDLNDWLRALVRDARRAQREAG